MTITDFIQAYWQFILIGLPVLYLFLKYKSGKKVFDLSLQDLAFVIELLVYVLAVISIEKYLFPGNNYFTLACILFSIVWAGVIYFVLSGGDVYVWESTFSNEIFHKQGDQPLLSQVTRNRLLVMDKKVYESKDHVGDERSPFWNLSPRLKTCDYFDDQTFFHPESPNLHNVTFYQAKAFWLWLKVKQPQLERENIKLTWLSDNKLAHEQNVIHENSDRMLLALKRQYEHDPMTLPDDIDHFKKLVMTEAKHSDLDKESQPQGNDNNDQGAEAND